MKKWNMLFGKLYIYCVKAHRGKGKGEAMWHAVLESNISTM